MAGSWNGTQYIGDATNEAVTGTPASESFFGAEGDDQLFGVGGNDYIDGGVGNDLLDGGAGDDILVDVGSVPFGFSGIIGHDTLRGGAGNDELRVYSADTGDVADGGAGFDLLRLNFKYFNLTGIPAGTPFTFTLGPGGAASQVLMNNVNILSVSNIEQLWFYGSDGTNFITTQGGDDNLNGGGGDDHIYAGAGNDQVDGGAGQQDLDGGVGFDLVSFDLSADTAGLTITNSANILLGSWGSAVNFEAFYSVKTGGGKDDVTITQAQALIVATGAGNDQITVADGGSTIDAGSGDDTINTGNGADAVEGGDGNNTAHMGGGDDRYVHLTSRFYGGSEKVWGDLGNDVIVTAAGADVTFGGDGNDQIYNGRGDDRSFGGLGNDTIRGEDGLDQVYGGDGNDQLDGDADALSGGALYEDDLLDGGLGNDTLTGGYGADRLYGGADDDTLTFGYSNGTLAPDTAVDFAYGGAGNDTLAVYGQFFSTSVQETVILAAHTLVQFDGVTLTDATGIEALYVQAYGSGNQHIEGGALYDYVSTGSGNDLIVTFGGNDIITTTLGADTIFAGSGDDTIQAVQVGGADDIDMGSGNDTVSLNLAYLSQVLEAGVSQLRGGAGFDTLRLLYSDRDYTFTGSALVLAGVKVADISGFEAIYQSGSNIAGSLTGSSGNDTLYGNGGNDTLDGLNGDDLLDGGANDDLVQGGGGNDTLLAGGGLDTLRGGGGDDLMTLVMVGLADSLGGGGGLDRLTINFGAASPVVMTGSVAGGGTISTGGVLQATISGFEVVVAFGTFAGNDVMLGGSGNDTLTLYGGGDTATTGNGDDLVQLSLDGFADQINLGGGIDRLTGGQALAGDVVFSLGGTTSVTINGVVVSTWKGVESFDFSLGSGNDSVQGGGLDDRIYLGDGANAAQMRLGNDTVLLAVDALADTVDGGGGSDRLVVYGGSAAITVDVSVPGVVTVDEAGQLRVTATAFEVVELYGGYGAGAGDRLAGLGGDDQLFGNAGQDTMTGGGGNDTLVGGADADVMTGGAGADSFIYYAALDAVIGATLDRITDFQQGADLITLTQIDANLPNGSFLNDAFAFVGALAFGGTAGELRFQQDVPTNQTLIEGDQNGDGVADFRIALTGIHALTAADFAL